MNRLHLLVMTATTVLAMGPVTTVGAAADPAAAPRPRLLSYSDEQGDVTSVTVHDPRKLPEAPASFRSFVDRRLTALWKSDLGSDPGCYSSAVIGVNAVRTDGYGMASVGTDRQRGCDRSVAGHVELYAKRNGRWRTIYGGEDIPPCARLVKVGFPSAVGVRTCMDGDQAVAYQHA
jgi:hypothetical protein